MFNLSGKNLGLKKSIITILCFVFMFACSGVLVYQNFFAKGDNTNLDLSTNIDENALVINWLNGTIEEDMTPSAASESKVGYSFEYSDSFVLSAISAGSTITVETNTSGCPEIKFSGISYPIKCVPHNGYKITRVSFKDGDGKLFDSQSVTASAASYEIGTLEQIDPNYTGQIVISCVVETIPYELSMYYLEEIGGNFVTSESAKQTYNVARETEVGIEPPIKTLQKDNVVRKTFSGWIFDNAAMSSNWYASRYATTFNVNSSTKKETIKIASSGAEIYITTTPNTINDNLYFIESIKGYGEIQQDSSNPIIRATYANAYDLIIDNSNTFWSQSGIDAENEEQLYGAYSNNTASGVAHSTSTTIQIASNSDNASYHFMDSLHSTSEGLAFFKKEDYTSDYYTTKSSSSKSEWYYVFNYGYYIGGWHISASIDGEEKLYFMASKTSNKYTWHIVSEDDFYADLDYIFDTWLIDSSLWSNFNNAGLTAFNGFAGLAGMIDHYFGDKSGIPTITIQPYWQAATINIVEDSMGSNCVPDQNDDGGEISKKSLQFNESYTISPVGSFDEAFNVVAYSYSSESNSQESEEQVYDNLIARSGVWNYTGISKETINSVYATASWNYSIEIEPVQLDKVYKIDLENVTTNDFGKYQLTNGAFDATNYEDDANGYNWDSDIISEINKKPVNYNAITHGKLIDNYIKETFSPAIKEYVDGINGDGKNDFELFNKVFVDKGSISTTNNPNDTVSGSSNFVIYLANNQKVGNLPTFAHSHQKLIFWNAGDKAYKTWLFNNKDELGETDFSQEISSNSYNAVSTWKASFGFSLTANYAYAVDLYYDTELIYDSTTGETKAVYDKLQVWYGPNTEVDISKVEPNDSRVFGAWTLDFEKAQNAGLFGGVNDGHIGMPYSIRFKLDENYGQNQFNLNLYYITSVLGASYIEQDDTNPAIYAKWKNSYNVTLDNTRSYWYALEADNTNLYGANSSDVNQVGSTATFKIADNKNYAYPFMTSNDNSFMHGDEWLSSNGKYAKVENDQNKWYYAYSYGEYISGWYIKAPLLDEKGDVKDHYFTWDNNKNKWNVSFDVDYSAVSTTTLQDLAAVVDDCFAGKVAGGIPTVTLMPKWNGVGININVNYDDEITSDVTTTFASVSKYTINYSIGDESLGKSIICYTYNSEAEDGALIATSAKWNYKNIPNGKFTPNGNNNYSITLTPVLVDNIYKVNLINVVKREGNEYQLTNTDFQFNAWSGSKLNGSVSITDGNMLNHNSNIDTGYSFKAYNKEVFVDDYILKLKEYLEDYTLGITNGTFDIFKKVYYKEAATARKSDAMLDNYDILEYASAKPQEFHIYLANGQVTGDLPVFKKEYYDLIFWENANSKYAYATELYKKDLHETELAGFTTHQDNDGNFTQVWYLKDGFASGNEVKFNAHYFRKNYILDINTYLKDGDLERRGYVQIEILDLLYANDTTITNRSGSYVVIYEEGDKDGGMKIYDHSVGGSIVNNTNLLNKTNSLEEIRLYEGCDVAISIVDQSKDITAMNSGNFDEMIGYKFSKTIDQVQPLFRVFDAQGDYFNTDKTPLTNVDYSWTESASNISKAGINYQSNTTVTLNVYFEKIIYNLNVEIDNANAGQFRVNSNPYRTSPYNIEEIKVGDFNSVEYYAFAGFRLQNNAFVLHNGKLIRNLQSYDDNNTTENSQKYNIKLEDKSSLEGGWLRTFFYSDWVSYPVEVDNLGTIIIKTCPIEFTVGIKIHDETNADYADQKYIIETLNKSTIKFDEKTGTMKMPSISEYLTNKDYGFYYYNSEALDQDYALLSSRLYFPSNFLTTKDNFYTTYSFLLGNNPTQQSTVSSYHLAFMVNDFDYGKIITAENNNREIFIMLEVRELLKINVKVAKLNNDSNTTQRVTTIKNGSNNSMSVITSENAVSSSGYYSNVGTIYTYHGLNNNISSVFDNNRYTAVEYYLNGASTAMPSNDFEITSDAEIVVKYIPKLLPVEFVYKLDGETLDKSQISAYIAEDLNYKPNSYSTFSLGDYVTYAVECVNNDYHVSVAINNMAKGSTTNSVRSVKCLQDSPSPDGGTVDNRYLVTDSDFDFGSIKIVVDINIKDNSKIKIQYQLLDTTKRVADDNYGTFNVYENENIKAYNVDVAEVVVVEGRNVYVSLDLPTGYVYKGIKKGSYSWTPVEQDVNGKVLLVEDFDPNDDAGDYLIIIDKAYIKAVLDTTDLKADYYINGASVLENIYVGSTIKFTNIDKPEERLGCFYYKNSAGDKKYITSNGSVNGTPLESIKITSELLEEVNSPIINFGVVAVNRYKLDIIIDGQDYVKEGSFATKVVGKGSEYDINSYVDEGTKVTFSIESLVEGKYDISFDGVTYNVIKMNDIVLTLDQNRSYILRVSPKIYNVVVTEGLYSTLTEVVNNNPGNVVENQVNNAETSGQGYNQTATIDFVRYTDDRELSTIHISDNDSEDKIMIVFNGANYKVYKSVDGGDFEEISLNSSDYIIEVTAYEKVKLTYTTLNNISIKFDYKLYKIINT